MPSKNEDSDMFVAPRWTEYLRTASRRAKPGQPDIVNLPLDDPNSTRFISIVEYQKSRVNRSSNRGANWADVKDLVVNKLHPSKHQDASMDFDKFFSVSKDIASRCEIPSTSDSKTDEVSIVLLNFFLQDYNPYRSRSHNQSVCLSQKTSSSIREYFGKIEPVLMNKLSQIFNSLVYWLDDLDDESLSTMKLKLLTWVTGQSSCDDEDDSSLFPFGRVPLGRLNPRVSGDHDEVPILNLINIQRLSKNGAPLTGEDKVMALFRDNENPTNDSCNNGQMSVMPAERPAKPKWDRAYLLNLVGNSDVLEALLNTISSDKSNDEIQEHLFDLLGFEKLDLIAKLLENRVAIMKEVSREEFLALAVRNHIATGNTTQSHPVIGVKVQSQGEKMLEKIYRKEERKVMKGGGSSLIAGVHPAETEVGQAMRAKVQTSVQTSHGPGSAIGVELSGGDLPNVYDSYAAAKQKAGAISGIKLFLPENVTRKNVNEYEEVSLPAVIAQVPPKVANRELIKISDLDAIGQKVFQGMKTLNRIQTLVFDTAYKTNENLLICAPTGAGKTNIALLTVIRCIVANTVGGIINKDQFKIVYVAPMKALAAEMTSNFAKRLSPLGIQVRELTGDMQLTKAEITQTQMLVTTPEKWDVVTRKSTGDVALAQIVKLLIIDEVHLLHGDRGPVVESLVARTLRQVESSQKMIRIVGLSATLPNYRDIALFLRVNARVGLFYFDSRFRPVPLGQTFIGVKGLSMLEQQRQMDSCCYEKVFDKVSKGHQVMVFVHARNATMKTAEILIELASKRGQLEMFKPKKSEDSHSDFGKALKTLEKSRNKKLPDLFQYGFSMHHAGMLRSDRSMIEKLFGDGLIRVLVCTATLAWGVNLPAHAVIIKGTEIYDAKQGSFVDLGILDVLQIFGRAGRPQFDTEGHGTIITTHDKLPHYLSLLTNQFPIESSFIKFLADNLNAEVALGSVTNIDEAVEWLTYTYLYVRMRRNPQLYGMQMIEAQDDPLLTVRRKELIVEAAKGLEKCKMIRYDERTEYLHSTDMGRTASHFYIKYDTVETFNEVMIPVMGMDMILMMISKASEFEQVKVRDDELDELDDLTKEHCHLKVWGGSENVHGKVSILIQTYISKGFIKSFSLMSDQQYVIQNAIRICRGFFEVVLRQNIPILAARLLQFSKMLDNQLWEFCHPLKQHKFLSFEVLEKLEYKKLSIDTLRETSADEIGAWINHHKMGAIVKRCAEEFPLLHAEVGIQPITRSVLRVKISIEPDFKWNDRLHGNVSESFWIWVEEPDSNYIYHSEYFIITKKQVIRRERQEIIFTIPITEPLPPQYYVKIVSDRFLGSEQTVPVSFQHLILPELHPPHTDLLDLDPLPISALKDTRVELLFSKRFSFFNPIQTQIFHTLYHTDTNVLVGAPTGSGKTIAAEFAMFRVFREYPKTKVVYIAPMKALVRERMKDWKERLEIRLNKKVVELTGDVTPDMRAIMASDVIVTTPEKWDGVSRSWQTRSYVQAVSLIIIDEIHLLGEDRGPVLEVIVSRTNYISQHTKRNLRVVGLSTALANARDLADWLGIKGFNGLFNFRPSVRPVPIQVHIQGFPGKHYCPRMATMNKPTFQAIREHSPSKPVLVFVSSRRQTRLTALDLIAYLAAEGNPKQWLQIEDNDMDHIIDTVKESNLKLTLSFGIGIHHAGLQENDRRIVEELFVNQKIQVLVATATLAWGVNFPAHLVVVKGTEYFDGKTHRYVDMPITDVLQMMGRAGRPQFDNEGVAVVLVHDQKKNFYKKFLYEPFPVESSLLDVLPDHLNAEVVAGTISTTQEALDYLTYTYFFRRLVQNPSYYELQSNEPNFVNKYLSDLISKAFRVLESASCLFIHEDLRSVEPTSFGRIAAYYYLSHQTMQLFHDRLSPRLTMKDLLSVMTDVYEYSQLPVRHNEDILNEELSKNCPIEMTQGTFNSPHTKAHLLLQCHFSRQMLPSSDYSTDLKSVLDQALRILQAMIDACAENGWLSATLHCINLIQMTVQGRWLEDDSFMILPYIDQLSSAALVKTFRVEEIPELQEKTKSTSASLEKCLLPFLDEQRIDFIYNVLHELPAISVQVLAQFDGRSVPIAYARGSSRPWVDLPPGKEMALIFHVSRNNRCPKDLKAFAPKFPKSKDEGWFILLGDTEHQDVIALKRTSGLKNKSQLQIGFTTPDTLGKIVYVLYLMSDCYIGLDQQYELCINVTSKAESTPPPGFN